MKLVMLGAPGAGKGTQAAVLSEKLNIPTISTGNILRAAVKDETAVGAVAKSYLDAGKLVPDDLILDILTERLAQPDCAHGYILDGAPRTLVQAQTMEQVGIHVDHVLSIEIADEVIEERMEGRRFCIACGATYHVKFAPPVKDGVCDKCGGTLDQREDDKPATVRRRLEIYHAATEPLKEFYAQRGLLRTVENQSAIEETTKMVMEALSI